MDGPPPPPPPHGEKPKTTNGGGGLGPGNYDIFIIPQRDKGGGFIYLPAMNANGPSFAAGFACALVLVVLFQSMAPAFKAWWRNFEGMGSTGVFLLIIAVGLVAWAMGQWQAQTPPAAGASPGGNSYGGAHYPGGSPGGTPNAGASSPPPPPPPHNDPPPNPNGNANERPKQSWQQPPPGANTRAESPPPPPRQPPPGPSAWERAREETKRKEEERKKKAEDDKRKAEAARRLREFREKETRERERREKEARERKEKAEAEEREKEELRQKLQKETAERERLEKEKADREAKEKEEALRKVREAEELAKKAEARKKELEELRKKEAEERLRRETETAARTARQGSTYAYSGVGEKTNPWPNGTAPSSAPPPPRAPASASASATASTAPPPPRAPASASGSARAPPASASGSAPAPAPSSASASTPKAAPSPTRPPRSTASSNNNQSRRPPAPSSRTHLDPDEETHSYRPYDHPRKSHHGRAASSVGSESSWAPSATTAHTTPPPSMRAPYTTKDPDKIVIKAVYLFMNQFAKTPASNLLSGVGAVTDGLILRVTTAGLFIDDDVRGVPQREWDVKAWTLKSVEVWCPQHCLFAPATPSSGSGPQPTSFLHKMAASQFGRAAERGAAKSLTGDEAEVYLTELHRSCRDCCRLGQCDGKLRDANLSTSAGQTGAWKARGLHVLRATIRDQENKRYLFVLDEEEAWKVAAGLQRLRKGTQARAVGVSGMSASDARNTLDLLGWL